MAAGYMVDGILILDPVCTESIYPCPSSEEKHGGIDAAKGEVIKQRHQIAQNYSRCQIAAEV